MIGLKLWAEIGRAFSPLFTDYNYLKERFDF